MLRHIRSIHTDIKDKPYKCVSCEKCFGLKGNLDKHVNIVHENFRPYKCDFCVKIFGFKNDLKKHVIAIHEKIKNLKCDSCDK